MENINVNIKKLTKIKNELEKSMEAWNSLLYGIESCFIEEDWSYAKVLGRTLTKAINKVRRILDSVEKSR